MSIYAITNHSLEIVGSGTIVRPDPVLFDRNKLATASKPEDVVGSKSHFFCNSVQVMSSAVKFDAHAVRTDGPVTQISDPNLHRSRILRDAFPQVMSYFEPGKHTSTGHSFIKSQRARWRELAMDARSLIIVGVRVHPEDDHVWGSISGCDARVVYCGGPTGEREYCDWALTNRVGCSDLVLPGYFSDEFCTILLEAGL